MVNEITDVLWALNSSNADLTEKQLQEMENNLQDAIGSLFKQLPGLFTRDEFVLGDDSKMIQGNEHFAHFLIDFASIRMPGWQKEEERVDGFENLQGGWIRFGGDHTRDSDARSQQRPDVSQLFMLRLLNKVIKAAMTCEMKWDSYDDAPGALFQIGNHHYLDVYRNHNDLQIFNCLGVHVDIKSKASVRIFRKKRLLNQSVEDFIDDVSKELKTNFRPVTYLI